MLYFSVSQLGLVTAYKLVVLQLSGQSAPRVAGTVPMSIIIVAASCISGVVLVLILIGVAGAVRCRHIGRAGRHRRTSGGGKRLPVNAGSDHAQFGPFDQDADGGYTASPRLVAAAELIDCSRCQKPKNRRGHVMVNGVKGSALLRRCSDESSVCTQLTLGALSSSPSRINLMSTGCNLQWGAKFFKM